ncbi:MAG: hypothetical protein JWO38_3285 [Gemmataceae bacterium]|nr:hypothetical protein [Gemmataceae bacterium]
MPATQDRKLPGFHFPLAKLFERLEKPKAPKRKR